MGALEIRNAKLRCPRCLDIRRLLIIPSIRKPKIEIMCHCNKSIENLLDFFNEINKVTDIKPVCSKCSKELIKHPRLCYDCLLIYCSKCCDNHLPKQNNGDIPIRASLVEHTTIHIEKLDYYCVDHQNNTFVGYCQQCLMNLCNECIREGTHKSHHVDIFSVIKPTNKDKDDMKNGIKNSESKIDRNNKKIFNFCRTHQDDKRTREIGDKYRLITEENNDILALLKYCFNLYKSSKLKNYSIIYNIIRNNKFNNKKLELEKANTDEEKFEMIFNYLKRDALILYKRTKTNKEKFKSDEDNEEEEEDDIIDEVQEEGNSNTNISSNNKKFIENNSKEKQNEIDNNMEDKFNLYENVDEDIDNINNNIYPENNKEENQDNIEENININKYKNSMEEINNKSNVNSEQNINNEKPKKLKMPTIFNQPQNEKKPISAKDIPRPKKLKMPSMFEKHEEEEKIPEKPLPIKANLKMPSIFEKKEEENKPKERAGIIKTGAIGNMGTKKDFLAQMLEKKKEMGMGIGDRSTGDSNKDSIGNNDQNKERNEIVQENNEGKAEEVINKVVVAKNKKKKPKRSKAFKFGEEFIEVPKPQPVVEIIEENIENKEQNDNAENNDNIENKENEEKKEISENPDNNIINKDEKVEKENDPEKMNKEDQIIIEVQKENNLIEEENEQKEEE